MAKQRQIPDLEMHDLADLFPVLPQPEYEALKADIKANGLLQPIVLHQGRVLDGRHRYLACKELGILPETKALAGSIDAASYVASANLLRRHLDASQRAIAAAELEDYQHGGRRTKKLAGQHSLDGLASANITRAEAAKMMKVSERSVAEAKKVLDGGVPEVIAEVKAGTIAVKDAAKVAALPEPQQRAALHIYKHAGDSLPTLHRAARQAEKEEKLAEAKQTAETYQNTERCQLHHKDISEMAEIVEAGSVDVIFTDPPYQHSSIDVYSDLAELAAHSLRRGGYLLVLTGCDYLPEWTAQLAHPNLKYNYCCHIDLSGTTQKRLHRRAMQKHKLMLWYVLEEHTDNRLRQTSFYSPLTDTAKASAEYHKWGQQLGLIEAIVAEFCQPADLVLDPFCGAGSTALAALKQGCRFIGSDIDAEALAVSKGRTAGLLTGKSEGEGEAND